jgi:EmrB/QacA subfamily drug resistance transporter
MTPREVPHTETTSSAEKPPTKLLVVIVPLIVGCAQFMHQFDGAVITTALPQMAQSLGDDPLRLNLAITCYLLALAMSVPISGWMADRFGARRVFMTAILVFTTASIMCGFSQNLAELALARTLQGAGGGMMVPVGRVIVLASVPKDRLVRAMNYITIPGVLGPVLGPPVGGFIVTYFSWQWIFWLNLPIGLLGLVLVHAYIPDVRAPSVPSLDVRGFLLVAVSIAGLVFGFEAMGRGLVPLPYIFAALAFGALGTLLYLLHARRTAQPIVDLTLMRLSTFRASITGGSLFYMSTTSSIFLFALMFQIGYGMSPFLSGLTILANAAGAVTQRFVLNPVLRVISYRTLLIGNALLGGVTLSIYGIFGADTPFWVILPVMFLGGFARAMQFAAVQTLAYAELSPNLMSRATSFSAMTQQMMQSFGVGLVAVIVHLGQSWNGGQLDLGDIAPAYFALGLLGFLSTIIFWRLPPSAGSELLERRR